MEQYVQFQNLIRSFNWHTPSWDLFIILFWLVASVLYAFSAGQGRILSILVSVYMAKLLVIEAPFLNGVVNQKLHIATASLQQLATFGALFLVLFFFLSKYGFKTSAEGKSAGSLIFGILFSVFQIGLLINIVLSFLPLPVQGNFAPLIKFLFLSHSSSFLWLILPVVFLVGLGKFISHRNEV